MKRSLALVVGGTAVALSGLGFVAACQVIDGIHVYAENDPEASVVVVRVDGGTVITYVEGGVAGVSDAACSLAKPPGPPDPASVTSTDENIYTLAFTSFSFTGNGTAIVGYDLDDTCTNEPTTAGLGPQSCLVVEGGIASTDVDYDPAQRGVDRQLAAIGVGVAVPLGQSVDGLANVNQGIANGTQTALLYIVGYNGTPNDPEVSVQLASSEWVQAINCVGAADSGATYLNHPEPQNDGCDTWSRDLNAADPVTMANKYISATAYVTDSVLVATFAADVVIPFGDTSLQPNLPMVVATLTFGNGNPLARATQGDAGAPGTIITINGGLLQGRITAESMLTALGGVEDPEKTSVNLCPDAGSPTFEIIRPELCNNLDITSNGDKTGTQPCDAFSFAATFTAVTATVGDTIAPTHPIEACAHPPPPCPLAAPLTSPPTDGGA